MSSRSEEEVLHDPLSLSDFYVLQFISRTLSDDHSNLEIKTHETAGKVSRAFGKSCRSD